MEDEKQPVPIPDQVVELLGRFKPKSVFLYGSRARQDFTERSDYEIGALFREAAYVPRSKIAEAVQIDGVNVYPFVYEDLLAGKVDTPFQQAIYLRELSEGAKTIHGEKVVEKLKAPPISTVDLMQEIAFDKGVAVAAVRARQEKDAISTSVNFAKSCLFGTRVLEILELQEFPIEYDQIYALSAKVVPAEHQDVVEAAQRVRKGGEMVRDDIFRNIALLNQYVEPRVLKAFHENGDAVVLP
ncbi:nucleotidyltransferase domain-containing protein [Patescibacteria group bacterium]|nr:nucleotidyltransferase domain-containing protein [Patescibacteria group bacterium]